MKDENKKILKNEFTWLPKDKRVSRFGGAFPPRQLELKKPLLWVDSKGIDFGHELYLINNTGEVIDSIATSSGGFATIGDDVITVASDECMYNNVQPNETVKIDEFDVFADGDYVIEVYVRLRSKKLGFIEIKTPSEKGGLKKETVLLWDTGEAGKFVSIKKI